MKIHLMHSAVFQGGCRFVEFAPQAEKLGIPLFGTDTEGAFWGTKTGNRQAFRVPRPQTSLQRIRQFPARKAALGTRGSNACSCVFRMPAYSTLTAATI